MATVGAEKNGWAISLLGMGIELISKVIQDGKIIGLDYSNKMLQEWKLQII